MSKKTCPNCGCCPHCGRSAQPSIYPIGPLYPYPWWQIPPPSMPWYPNTATITVASTPDGITGNTTTFARNENITYTVQS